MKIGITGSLSSGKSAALKMLARNKYPSFSADHFVRKLYKKKKFQIKLKKKFKIQNIKNIKKQIKDLIIQKKIQLVQLEELIHPIIRKNMKIFLKKNIKKRLIFLEIPLLIESKLKDYFDIIIFIEATKKIRLKRYMQKGGNKKIFLKLDKNQINQKKKKLNCDYLVVNNRSIKALKKRLMHIICDYE